MQKGICNVTQDFNGSFVIIIRMSVFFCIIFRFLFLYFAVFTRYFFQFAMICWGPTKYLMEISDGALSVMAENSDR